MNKTAIIVVASVLAVVLLVGAGYGIASWRHQARIAGADAREQEALKKIAANDAASNRLRGENDILRKEIAELSAEEEALKQAIKERGGAIAVEAQKLEQINEQLKNDQAVIAAPSDSCTRCQRFSANALKQRLIDKPLACAEECRKPAQ